MQDSESFHGWQSLGAALRGVFADRWWWLKIAVGGGLMLTLVGIIFPQGLLIEHIDNTKRGFRTPLPSWRQWTDKAVMGLLATVLDFVYFLFPAMGISVILFCGVVPLLLKSAPTATSVIVVGTLLALFLFSFLSSVSPISKIRFAQEGDIEGSLGMVMVRRALNRQYRDLYVQARLVTLPVYIPALISSVGLWSVFNSSTPSLLLFTAMGWITACCLFWAWIIVEQVYSDAASIAADREIDARLAERKRQLQLEQSRRD